MKFGNRHGDVRANILRIGDVLKNPNNGKFKKIVNIRQSPMLVIDLTPAGGDIAGIPDLSAGQLAVGTLAAPTEGPVVPVPLITPIVDNEIVMAFVGVYPSIVAFIPTALGGAAEEALQKISCFVRYRKPAGVNQWLTPDEADETVIDTTISPPEDPNDLFPLFIFRNEDPVFQALNPHLIALGQVIMINPIMRLIVEDIEAKDVTAYRTLPATQCPGFKLK